MSFEKQINNNDHLNEKVNCNSVFIEISHYENDKHLKTETFSMTHFLDNSEKDLKKISYN